MTIFRSCPDLFGVRNETQQATYNYLRFEMPSIDRWEFEIEPVSGWEIRSQAQQGRLWKCSMHGIRSARRYWRCDHISSTATLQPGRTFRGQMARPMIRNWSQARLWFDSNNRATAAANCWAS